MSAPPVTTYRVVAAHATVRSRPGGPVLRRLALYALLQGRPSVAGWVERVADNGAMTGYVRADQVELFAPHAAPPERVDTPQGLGDMVDRLSGLLSRGRAQRERIALAFSDVAAEVISRSAAQSASVTVQLVEQLETLERRIVALELRERAVGE